VSILSILRTPITAALERAAIIEVSKSRRAA
jgi:hypothetical protein